jgi:hypothetical protein
MQEKATVWMRPPGGGPPKEVPANPQELVTLMVAGWSQCEPPAARGKSKEGEMTDHGEHA